MGALFSTDIDASWRTAANLSIFADWGQTRRIAKDDRFYERNHLLGKTPTSNEVNRYFLGLLLATNALGEYAIPIDKKKYFYMGLAGMGTANVLRNYSLGIRGKF